MTLKTNTGKIPQIFISNKTLKKGTKKDQILRVHQSDRLYRFGISPQMIDTFLPHEYFSVSLSIMKYRLEHSEKDISSQISL